MAGTKKRTIRMVSLRVRGWMYREGRGWTLVVMDDVGCDVEVVDVDVDVPGSVADAGKARGAMAMASSNSRSCSHRRRASLSSVI